mgnify:FL=1
MFDEDLRNPQNMPPPLMGPNFRSFDVEEEQLRREKMMQGDVRQRDLDLRHPYGNNDYNQGANYGIGVGVGGGGGGDFPEPRLNFHPRNNYNSRDMDFRNYEDRNNRGPFQRNDMDFRSRDYDQRNRDYDDRFDDRENYDVGSSKDNSFDDRPSFNSSNNMFNPNQRWDEGPSQDNGNWGNRPPPLMSANLWENNDLDFRNFPNRGFQGGGGGGGGGLPPNNNFGPRGKSRIGGGGGGGGGRGLPIRSRPRRGRGRFLKN